MEHLWSSLYQLFSFSHNACDAMLQARGIEVMNAYNPSKHEDDVYGGLIFILGWEALVIGFTVRAWRKPTEKTSIMRYAGFLFAAFGLMGLWLQLQAMAAYVDTCKAVLHLR